MSYSKGNRDIQTLESIILYCNDVSVTIERFGNDYSAFKTDRVFQNAVSMPIMQIGEECKNISPELRKNTEDEIDWKSAAGMRDRYAHGYSSMSLNTIWKTAVFDVPALKAQCENLLSELQRKELDNSEK